MPIHLFAKTQERAAQRDSMKDEKSSMNKHRRKKILLKSPMKIQKRKMVMMAVSQSQNHLQYPDRCKIDDLE
jgi:hypothetical protein